MTLGRDKANLALLDRTLADAGLRAKASGRAVPDLNEDYMVKYLLKVLGARTTADAVTDVDDVCSWVFFHWHNSNFSESMRRHLVAELFGVSLDDVQHMTLPKAVAAVAKRLAVRGVAITLPSGELIEDGLLGFEVEVGGGRARFLISAGAYHGEMEFAGIYSREAGDLRETRRVTHRTLERLGQMINSLATVEA